MTRGQPSQECGGNTYCFARKADSLQGTGYKCAAHWPLVACKVAKGQWVPLRSVSGPWAALCPPLL